MSPKTHLHIVSFDNPYPPNYGGVIDVYYKIKALKQLGVSVTLHAFEYGRTPAAELNAICDQVYYYQRRNFVNPFIGSLPYIVNTRNSEELLVNLLKDNNPILFEGLHTCYFLDHLKLRNRLRMVRMHNIEHDYYARLEQLEPNFFKKYFFSKEALRLQQFEQVLHHANVVLAISHKDQAYLSAHFRNVHYVPAFHANESVTATPGKGDYAFYHGKLSVGENDDAARFLANKVFSETDYSLCIAGDKPSKYLRKSVEGKSNIQLLDHLETQQISTHIAQAHINTIPTFQDTGIKLKLINVLYQGRHVLANPEMVRDTGLQELCHVAVSPEDFVYAVNKLKDQPFGKEAVEKRREVLDAMFCNQKNAALLLQLVKDNA